MARICDHSRYHGSGCLDCDWTCWSDGTWHPPTDDPTPGTYPQQFADRVHTMLKEDPVTVWRRCNKCRSESDIAQNIDRCPACKAAWVGREFERAGDEGHDERLEPSDDVIAALQSEIVRQRERDENMLTVAKFAEECSAQNLLSDAAVLLRAYELRKGEEP